MPDDDTSSDHNDDDPSESVYSKCMKHPLAPFILLTWRTKYATFESRLTDEPESFWKRDSIPRLWSILEATDRLKVPPSTGLATIRGWKPKKTRKYKTSVTAYIAQEKEVMSQSDNVLESYAEDVKGAKDECTAREEASGALGSFRKLQTMNEEERKGLLTRFNKSFGPYTDRASDCYSENFATQVSALRQPLFSRVPCETQGQTLLEKVDEFRALEQALWDNDRHIDGYCWSLAPSSDPSQQPSQSSLDVADLTTQYGRIAVEDSDNAGKGGST